MLMRGVLLEFVRVQVAFWSDSSANVWESFALEAGVCPPADGFPESKGVTMSHLSMTSASGEAGEYLKPNKR